MEEDGISSNGFEFELEIEVDWELDLGCLAW